MEKITQEMVLISIVLTISGIGIILKLISWTLYKRLENASCNMGNNRNTLTRQMRIKFENCYKLNLDIKNIPAFVEKYIRSYKIFGMQLYYFQKILQICAVITGIICTCGAFFQYINGSKLQTVIQTLFVGVTAELVLLLFELLFETRSMPKRIAVNLEEYLENVLSHRLQLEYDDEDVSPVIEEELLKSGGAQTAASRVKLKKTRNQDDKSAEEEKIIRDIIKEFLY